MRTPSLPDEVEAWRDRHWCRDETLRVQQASDAERFVDRVGFAAGMTDARRPGPSTSVHMSGRVARTVVEDRQRRGELRDHPSHRMITDKDTKDQLRVLL